MVFLQLLCLGFSSNMVVQVDQENLNFEPILEIPNMGGNVPTVSTYRDFSNQPYATTYHCSWFCLSPYLEYHIKQIDKELAKFDSVEISKKGQDLSNSFIPFKFDSLELSKNGQDLIQLFYSFPYSTQ